MDGNQPTPRLRAATWATLRPRQGHPWLDWLKGAGFLVFHIDLFLVGIAALLLLNISRSPGHIWVGGVMWRWGLLLGIHGMATLLIWLIGLLLSEERPGAGTYEADWSAAPRADGRAPFIIEPGGPAPESPPWMAGAVVQDGDGATAPPWRPPEPAPAESDWQAGFEQRTSWSETTAAAWLSRHRSETDPAGDEAPDSPSDQAQ